MTKHKNIFSKGYTENWTKGILTIDFVLKSDLGRIKLKIKIEEN